MSNEKYMEIIIRIRDESPMEVRQAIKKVAKNLGTTRRNVIRLALLEIIAKEEQTDRPHELDKWIEETEETETFEELIARRMELDNIARQGDKDLKQ